jgi:regulator of protease activity HflC (stomatin/prohibitin superfamily)
MTGFLEFLGRIWGSIVFCRIIETWQQGVRFRRGKPEAKPLPAGIWFHWPTLDRIEPVPCKPRYIDLPVQSVTTQDNETVTFSANICYDIENAVLAITEVHDLEDFMSRASMGHLHGKIHERNLGQLMADLKELEKSLEGTLHTRVKRWGIRVLDVKLTDMVRAGFRTGQVRLYQG